MARSGCYALLLWLAACGAADLERSEAIGEGKGETPEQIVSASDDVPVATFTARARTAITVPQGHCVVVYGKQPQRVARGGFTDAHGGGKIWVGTYSRAENTFVVKGGSTIAVRQRSDQNACVYFSMLLTPKQAQNCALLARGLDQAIRKGEAADYLDLFDVVSATQVGFDAQRRLLNVALGDRWLLENKCGDRSLQFTADLTGNLVNKMSVSIWRDGRQTPTVLDRDLDCADGSALTTYLIDSFERKVDPEHPLPVDVVFFRHLQCPQR